MGQAQAPAGPAHGPAQPLLPQIVPAVPRPGVNGMGATMNLNFAPPPRWGARGRRRGGLALNRLQYTQEQREIAIRLLNSGLPCRQITRMIATPHQGRREHIRRQEQRRRMDEMRRRRML